MSEETERNSKGQFEKGVSGNKRGRKPGIANKNPTARTLQEYVGKRTQSAFDAIHNIIQSEDTSDSLKLKAALAYVTEDRALRKEVRDVVKHELEMKKLKENNKEAEDNKKPEEKKRTGEKVIDFGSFGKKE